MTLDDIKNAIASIKKSAWDNEDAHGQEDDLHKEFIRHVAKTTGGELAEMAKLCLTTSKIKFTRWYS